MATRQAEIILRHIRKLAAVGTSDPLSDQELLRRFALERDETAFTALVRRHGPLVLGVCRRVLHNEQDAEDAFQAAFLILAKKAVSPRWHASIRNWLYLVAYRVALRAKNDAARRHAHEIRSADRQPADPMAEITLREAQALLDEELARLPARYRAPLLLCCLEGTARDEAAKQLGCSLGTLKHRLEQGRELLRCRLSRRGLTLSAALFGTMLSESATPAAVPASLVASTFTAASLSATGQIVSGTVSLLAEGVCKTMMVSKLKIIAALATLLAGVVGLGAGMVLKPSPAAKRVEAEHAAPTQPLRDKQEQGRTDRYEDPLPPGALLRLGTVRLRHKEGIGGVAFTADGKILVTGGEDLVIRLWDPATGKELGNIVGHEGRLAAIACSPDGKTLASAGSKTIHLWEMATVKPLQNIPSEAVQTIAGGIEYQSMVPLVFSPTGETLASVAADHSVRLWEVASGKERFRSPAQKEAVSSLGFSPDGKMLFSASGQRTKDTVIRVWEPAAGKELRQIRIPGGQKESGFRPFTFSPDGKTLALEGWAVTQEKRGAVTTVFSVFRIHLWDLTTGQQRLQLDAEPDVIWAAAFSPDSKTVACARMSGSIAVWDANTGRLLFKQPAYPEGTRPDGAHTIAFSPNGKTLATVGSGAVVHLWEVATGRELLEKPEAHQSAVTRVIFSPDGKTLASASSDQTIRLWDASAGRQRVKLAGHKGSVAALAFSRDGKILASSGADDTIHLWDTATGKDLHTLKEIRKPRSLYFNFGGRSLVFTPGGKSLASWGEDRMLRLWDVATGKEQLARQARLDGVPDVPEAEPGKPHPPFPTDQIVCTTFTPDGKTVLLASHQTVFLVDVATGQEIFRFPRSQNQPNLALSSDGQTLVAGGWDKTVRLWELATGKEILQVGGLDSINAVAIAPDGRSVAVATGWIQGAIHLLDVATGKELLKLEGHRSYIGSLAFGPDGKTLASGQRDTTILIWDIAHAARPVGLPKKDLNGEDLDRLWSDLAAADGPKAHTAVWTLTDNPEKAAILLKDRLRPAPATDPRQVQRLIADLDSKEFGRREEASRELKKLGVEAEPALRQVLLGTPTAEARRRVEALLATPAPWVSDASETIRRIRGIQVLERIASHPARLVLETLAGGAATARETQNAKAALERLARTSGVAPQ